MGGVAFLFAGQGAQHPGMGAALAEREAAAQAVFAAADPLRPGTSDQCFSGTADELNQTANTQPCVFACDLACAKALEAHGVTPAAVAGFSLGEVAALTFAGALSDAQGFELVCHRARFMDAAARRHPGSMRAVLKLDAETVEHLAREAGEAWPVNYNSPKQTVVAGSPEALEALDVLVKAAGGRSMPVAVSGAFHSPYMEQASRELAAYLDGNVQFAAPRIPVIANLTAAPYPSGSDEAAAQERAETLAAQASHPVQWVNTLHELERRGIDTFIEVGPGKTLTGLAKRTLSDVKVLSCETPEELDAVLTELGTAGLTPAN
ncbi:ACP S-malonyltransferase [uncultured Enorma sp.]|uniref:ACP S-malonyltransferase n=1 Tax=uncultured Enorma sp. TaxID=1714346 RepID=UPI00265FEC02|nr:ACP S-malonyltransferase [uncultured Enorma sp.]